jgi:phosphatidylglycerophosphatase A
MTDASPAARSKPTLAYLIATSFGLGYLKPGPGTWGSLAGVALSILIARANLPTASLLTVEWAAIAVISAIGVAAATSVARHCGKKDPQFVVIDEVSGQLIALSFPMVVLNWKTWLAGFILFRVFDIWKPFPARSAESLPEGWGIMADDWIAGLYAGILLLLTQHFFLNR